jgi:crotonobetainyl-CoA:carnitine CoA-transferase CaiB-like acyl-CoA transferase
MTEEETGGMLNPYRVLDLTDEKGLLCGKLLGDLGADVIKIERPGGDPARSIGPFYHDEVDPEKSLFWWACNTSKRGITLDISRSDGQDIFRRLVQTADFVAESFSPGYLDGLGLGYAALEGISPQVIMVSITPFGQTGPYRDYRGADNVLWGMGGEMFPFGDADRPPVRISHHSQAYLHAGLEGAVGALMALFHRNVTGEGQHVDVSVQESVARRAHHVAGMWDMERIIWPHGTGITLAHRPNIPEPGQAGLGRMGLWPCKDGYVTWTYWFGIQAKRTNPVSIGWLEGLGLSDEWLRGFDASEVYWADITPELIDRILQPISAVFMQYTKSELLESALWNGVSLYPVSDGRDILENAHQSHLEARGFWTRIKHPVIGESLTYPGPFARTSQAPPRIARAPAIGEHNEGIYGELGIAAAELEGLRRTGVI